MNLYPLALRLDGRRVLVVGGGMVATRRVPALLDAGASVVVVSPSLTPALRAVADAGRLMWVARRFEPADVDGAWLVHVAVNDHAAAERVSAAAEERGVFCVRADDRHAASAWTPAVTRHGPVTVAVLAGGDPRRAVLIRDAIREGLMDGTLPGCATTGWSARQAAARSAGSGSAGSGLTGSGSAGSGSAGLDLTGSGSAGFGSAGSDSAGLDAAFLDSAGSDPAGLGSAGSDAADLGSAGSDAADLGSAGSGSAGGSGGGTAADLGRVALVGAGPGDPELITVKGRRLLAEADVVVADRLVPGLLLDELRPDVELVDASKIPYGPQKAQEEINGILVDRARAGAFVVRLKGGDPYVFGRGGEEVVACARAGVPVTVVPGVSSAVAAPAVAGIPVTHRGVAHEFTVVSGHVAPDDPASLVDWPALARMRGTLVVLMGLKNLAAITAALVAHGRSPSTPAAVVQEGTTSVERSLRGTLGGIADAVKAAGLRPPAVLVVGEVIGTLD